MFDAPPDTPQSIGDLIGRSFRLYRRHVTVFFRTLLGPTIVSAAGSLGMQYFITSGLKAGSLEKALLPAAAVAASFFLLMAAKWVLTIRQLAFVRMAAGFAGDYRESHENILRKKWQILLLSVFALAALVVLCAVWAVEIVLAIQVSKAGALLAIVSAIGALAAPFGLAFSVGFIVLSAFLASCVIACEDERMGGIVARGLSLACGDFWRACAFGLLLYVAVSLVTIPLSAPLFIASVTDAVQHGITAGSGTEAYQMPLYLMVLSQIWESLMTMFLWPTMFVAFGLFYHDLRLRQEALDLTRQLDALEVKPR